MIKVINVWDLDAPVTIEYKKQKYTIPHDNMVYFLPEELRSHNFKGLLRILPDDLPLKKHYPKKVNLVNNVENRGRLEVKPIVKEPIEAFPESIYKEPDYTDFEYVEPQKPDYFPSFKRDKDDPDSLVDVKDIPPTITKRKEEVANGEKPLKGIRVNKKVRDEIKQAGREKWHSSIEKSKNKKLGLEQSI